MNSNLVQTAVDSTFTFTIVMADSHEYNSTIRTQRKDLNFLNLPSSHQKTQRSDWKGKSIADCFLVIAKLGGYLGRKRDSPPGNAVTWRGTSRLHDLVIGFNLGAKFVGN
jgi:hypothetical protein